MTTMAEYRRVLSLTLLNLLMFIHITSGQDGFNRQDLVRNRANQEAEPRNDNILPKRDDTNLRGPAPGPNVNVQPQNVPMQNDHIVREPINNADSVNKGFRQMSNNLKQSVRNVGAAARVQVASSVIKLAEHPSCKKDVEAMCSKTLHNNFQILDCLQNDKESEKTVSDECQNLLWGYKQNLTLDMRFDSAASQVCKEDLAKLTDCNQLDPGTGKRISCLIEHKDNATLITKASCRQFLTKMSSIIFSDYRLICNFAEKCKADILKLQCGRIDSIKKEEDSPPHSQGKVIECLSRKVRDLDPECKHEILRIAELQSDDFHEDRPLYYACRGDRERFCANVPSGNGKIYKCLFKRKFERSMSTECRSQLTRRQSLMQEDVKVNRGMMQQCRADAKRYRCFQTDGASKLREAKQAQVLTCLEGAIRDNNPVDPECVAELKELRRSLMQDYMINPDLVMACDEEIKKLCNGGLERQGKTMHCLMDVARKHGKNDQKMSSECKTALEDVIEEADPGESLSMDPALEHACGTVANTLCNNKKDDNGNVISCLMEKIGSDDMTDECEERLLEIQYFIARDFRLDPRLYKFCKTESIALCSASDGWTKGTKDTTPERGAHTFACLYRHFKFDEVPDTQLSRACAFEVRRVMRQRAISVELNPRIQEPCLQDLSFHCNEQVKRGEELKCLQVHFKELELGCQKAVGNFTQDQDKDVRMDKILMKKCTPMIKMFCSNQSPRDNIHLLQNQSPQDNVHLLQELLDDKSTEPGEVMDCLIDHKTNGNMDPKCRAGIEHHQLISLNDYRFSYKFKEACKQDVLRLCKNGVKTKAEVVKCLSETVRNDTLKEKTQRVSVGCRSQLTFQLLQRSESISLDPKLHDACSFDVDKFCSNVSPGSGAILECLRKHEKELSERCKGLVFKRQQVESVNVKGDFFLFKQCKRMIKTYCPEARPGQVFKCLREHKSEEDFDALCKKALLERMREKAKDIRLNVNLMAACKMDITKFCQTEMNDLEMTGAKLEGKVMECLRIQFARKRLTTSCTSLVGGKVRESALDYKQDPMLATSCKEEIEEHCKDKVVAKDLDDHGQVEECLKTAMLRGQITKLGCMKAVARALAESKADVHSDPVLYRACAMDIKHYCQGVPRGEGRQMSCLLAGLEDRKARLTETCSKMLRERKEMWENAAEQAPPETLNEVLHLVVISPSRNYLMSFVFITIGIIFFFGLCCGRVSKRIRREMKDR